MEYIRVKAVVASGKTFAHKENKPWMPTPVIINGQKNGYEGETLTVEEGFCIVSIDVSSLVGAEKSEEKTVEVSGTTPNFPMEVYIAVS